MSESPVFVCPTLSNEIIDAFRAAGFKDKTYQGQEGVFLAKVIDVQAYPYFAFAHSMDEPEIDFIVELVPEGAIQYSFDDDPQYFEFVEHRQDWIEVAKAAGVKLPFDE